jgi:hypothetical protein
MALFRGIILLSLIGGLVELEEKIVFSNSQSSLFFPMIKTYWEPEQGKEEASKKEAANGALTTCFLLVSCLM